MDLRMLSLGERIAAVSGAALFLFLFVSWLEGLSAWELFDIVDVLLAILALVVVALPLARAAGAEPPIRPSNRRILVRIGIVVLTITVAFFLEGADRGVGIFLAVLAAAGILYGASTMPEEEDRFPRRRDRTRRPLAEEDYEEPPPGMESWRGSGAHGGAEEPREERPRERRSEPPAGGDPFERPVEERAEPLGEGDEGERPRRDRAPAPPTDPEPTEARRRRGPPPDVPPAQ